MEEELEAAKKTLLEEEAKLSDLVRERDALKKKYERANEKDDKIRKELREKDHAMLVKEGDICLLKKKVKRLTYKIEIASKMSEIELEDDIQDLKGLLTNVGDRLRKNQELVVETFGAMQEIFDKGKEVVRDIEASKQQAMGECDVRTDKLQSRLDARQAYVDQKKAEIKEIRRASGIPDPEELAEIRRLAALNDQKEGATGDD